MCIRDRLNLDDYDAVLFVYGVDTLSQSDAFTRLSLIETPA